MARTLTYQKTVAELARPYRVALQKAAAESGWDAAAQQTLLLMFLAGVAFNTFDSDVETFGEFLAAASKDEFSNIIGRPAGPVYHGERAVDEDEAEDDEEDDDLDDDEDDDLDDDEDDFDDDLDDEFDDDDDFDDDLDDEDDDDDDDLDDDEE
jgi:hypothetical protein